MFENQIHCQYANTAGKSNERYGVPHVQVKYSGTGRVRIERLLAVLKIQSAAAGMKYAEWNKRNQPFFMEQLNFNWSHMQLSHIVLTTKNSCGNDSSLSPRLNAESWVDSFCSMIASYEQLLENHMETFPFLSSFSSDHRRVYYGSLPMSQNFRNSFTLQTPFFVGNFYSLIKCDLRTSLANLIQSFVRSPRLPILLMKLERKRINIIKDVKDDIKDLRVSSTHTSIKQMKIESLLGSRT